MATIPIPPYRLGTDAEGDYRDGKPLAETPLHRDNLIAAVKILQRFFAEDALGIRVG